MTDTLNDSRGFNELTLIQRKQQTPTILAYQSISVAREYWHWYTKGEPTNDKSTKPTDAYIEASIALSIESSATNGDHSASYIKTLTTDDMFYLNEMFYLTSDASHALLQVMETVISYSAQAIQSDKNEENVLAWTYACDAKYWSGILKAAIIQRLNRSPLSKNASKAASVKLERDPIQIALQAIESHYEENKHQFKRRGYTSQFVREMHDKYKVISDPKCIAKRVAKLNKCNELIPR